MLVYFSSASGNTERFIQKLDWPAQRIPLHSGDPELQVNQPYVLLVPTYGGGNIAGAVPKPVIRFLNCKSNRDLIRGVIATGNTNFGTAYGLAGKIISAKCGVPHLYTFELLGTPADLEAVQTGLETWWQQQR
ncbi:MAG: class Ib ribonucleoside-diphosphate reductase assembly flavoprotein NrdI [Bifidobacteriaceae bacterium]|nr:class Ib ribonucleoside-diphosphate reductase assembly flavoprotein NrdI [Bifidobacteriaceae bacterium]